jgi:catechol 2,3-dioxygenase-like lactoylglutathione lyase family enzyme
MAISDEGHDGTRGFKVRALGEIAIRCDDLGPMVAFYEDIIGLDRLPGNASPDIVFFRIAEGFGGHTTVLALFDKPLSRTDRQQARRPRNRRPLLPPPHRAEPALRGTGRRRCAGTRRNGLTYRVETFRLGRLARRLHPGPRRQHGRTRGLTIRAFSTPDPLHLSQNTHNSRKGIALARLFDRGPRPAPQIAALRISSR